MKRIRIRRLKIQIQKTFCFAFSDRFVFSFGVMRFFSSLSLTHKDTKKRKNNKQTRRRRRYMLTVRVKIDQVEGLCIRGVGKESRMYVYLYTKSQDNEKPTEIKKKKNE